MTTIGELERGQPAATPPPPASSPPKRRDNCDDCGGTFKVLWHHGDPDDPDTLRFCGGCLRSAAPSVLSIASRASTWRPEPGEPYPSRAEVGSYDPPSTPPPPRPRPKPAMPTRKEARELWPKVTSGVRR